MLQAEDGSCQVERSSYSEVRRMPHMLFPMMRDGEYNPPKLMSQNGRKMLTCGMSAKEIRI